MTGATIPRVTSSHPGNNRKQPMRYILLTIIFLSINAGISAQAGTMVSDTARPVAGSVREAFQKGRFHGNFRSYFMATDNTRQLQDYYALAAGGGMNYQTAAFHGFRFRCV